MQGDHTRDEEVLHGFRERFHGYATRVREAVSGGTDTTVLDRLGQDLQELRDLSYTVRHHLYY